MRITSTAAMAALRWANTYDGLLSNSVKRLSSGMRINSAADDPAGLAISEKMRAQINGLNQAAANAQDGISLIQTAEGGLNETHAILQRMRVLAVQAANTAVMTPHDISQIQKEYEQLAEEVSRIASSTEYNTKNLLDGSCSVESNPQNALISGSGVEVAGQAVTSMDNSTLAELIKITDTSSGVHQVEILQTATAAQINGAAAFNGGVSGSLILEGTSLTIDAADSLNTIISKINNISRETGIQANINSAGTSLDLSSTDIGSTATITVAASSTDLMEALGLTASGAGLSALSAIGNNAVGMIDGKLALAEGNTLYHGTVVEISDKIQIESGSSLSFDGVISAGGEMVLQVGANPGQTISFGIADMSGEVLGIDDLDFINDPGGAITAIDKAINAVSSERSTMGALQNRLEHTINNLSVAAENLAAAESRIRDVDMAEEISNMTKYQILNQVALAMLAQANQQRMNILKLLQ